MLYSRVLRDHFMYAATEGLIDLKWSLRILAEMRRNLLDKVASMTPQQADLLEQGMSNALPRALVHHRP